MEDAKNPSIPLSSRAIQIRALLPITILQLLVLFLVLYCPQIMPHVVVDRVHDRNTTAMRPSSVAQRIIPPSSLMHTMSDKVLFRQAISRSNAAAYPSEKKPKIAFMFLTKRGLPLSPLWERFFKGGHRRLYSIYIHSMPSYRPNFPPSSVFYKRQIPSQVSQWGKISICDAERRLIANALLDISNQRFVLLSESCIPLYNFTVIHNYITNSTNSFVNSFDAHGGNGRGRYNRGMSPVINLTEWRKGSQWFEVDRGLAHFIVRDTKFYPKFAEFCKPPCYVDEHYIPTALSIEAGSSLANRSLTWLDWSRGGAHLETFGGAERFMRRVYGESRKCWYNGRVTSVCYLFARKFSRSALPSLFLIAPRFLGF